MNISDDLVVTTELSDTSKVILLIGKTSGLKEKADVYAHHIQTCRNDGGRDDKMLYQSILSQKNMVQLKILQ